MIPLNAAGSGITAYHDHVPSLNEWWLEFLSGFLRETARPEVENLKWNLF